MALPFWLLFILGYLVAGAKGLRRPVNEFKSRSRQKLGMTQDQVRQGCENPLGRKSRAGRRHSCKPFRTASPRSAPCCGLGRGRITSGWAPGGQSLDITHPLIFSPSMRSASCSWVRPPDYGRSFVIHSAPPIRRARIARTMADGATYAESAASSKSTRSKADARSSDP